MELTLVKNETKVLLFFNHNICFKHVITPSWKDKYYKITQTVKPNLEAV